MVIPFLATAGWYAAWLGNIKGGASEEEAARMASMPLDTRRDFRRTLVGSPQTPVMLSVPVAKGPGLVLSEHGNWPHVHLGTLNALYGRAPYFQHLFPEIEEIYHHLPETLPQFSARLHALVVRWIDMDAVRMMAGSPDNSALRERGKEIATYINYNLSILDALFRLGRTTGLALAIPRS